MTISDLANGGFALVLVLLTVGVATILGLWVKDDSARSSRRRKRR
jgi:hypothetical protein